MDINRSWSIDDRRLNFQFGCEIGWEIKNGKLGRMLRNPTYTGIGPRFWQSMDMLSSEIIAWGTPNCGKGQPGQIGHTGHPAAPARFTERTGGGAGMSRSGARSRGPGRRAGPAAGRRGRRGRGDRRPHGAGADPVRQLAHPPERRRRDHHRPAAAAPRRPDGRRLDHRARRRRADGPGRAHHRGGPALPARPGWPGLAPPAPVAARRHLGRGDRAGRRPRSGPTGYAAFVDAAGGLETAGYCRTVHWSGAFANTAGQSVTGPRPPRRRWTASPGSRRRRRRGPARLAPARRPRRRRARRPGGGQGAGRRPTRSSCRRAATRWCSSRPRSPTCCSNFALFGFNGKMYDERQSFAELGAAQFDPAVTIVDD